MTSHPRVEAPSQKKHKGKPAAKKPADDFVSVARRLEANEDKATFEAKLAKIVKAKSRDGK
jgi:hypothetical protein